jgi:hypothetical protein
MRRFVPGVDSYLGAGVPSSLMRFSEPESSDAVGPADGHDRRIPLISERATSFLERYRQLCYWRQVVNAENN